MKHLRKQTSIEDKFEYLNCFVKFVVIEQLSAEFFLLQFLVFGHSSRVYWESPRDHPNLYLHVITQCKPCRLSEEPVGTSKGSSKPSHGKLSSLLYISFTLHYQTAQIACFFSNQFLPYLSHLFQCLFCLVSTIVSLTFCFQTPNKKEPQLRNQHQSSFFIQC